MLSLKLVEREKFCSTYIFSIFWWFEVQQAWTRPKLRKYLKIYPRIFKFNIKFKKHNFDENTDLLGATWKWCLGPRGLQYNTNIIEKLSIFSYRSYMPFEVDLCLILHWVMYQGNKIKIFFLFSILFSLCMKL